MKKEQRVDYKDNSTENEQQDILNHLNRAYKNEDTVHDEGERLELIYRLGI